MGKQRRKPAEGGSNEWLNTYADMVTLLLCFFILLFTMSSIDAEKWKTLIRAFQDPAELEEIVENDDTPTIESDGEEVELEDLTFLKDDIEKLVNQSEFISDVELIGNESIVFLRLSNNLLFSGDSAVLRSNTIEFLDLIGDALRTHEESIMFVRINGHTATVDERPGRTVSDRILSTERANAVLMYLEDVKDIAPNKLIAMGYGKNYPIATNDTEEGRSKNRRVEILIMGKSLEQSGNSAIYEILGGEFNVSSYDQFDE
jgi:chemotaxis protein MotB